MPKKVKKGLGTVKMDDTLHELHAAFRDAENYNEFHNRMMEALDVEVSVADVPEVIKGYIQQDEAVIEARGQLTKDLQEKMIKQSAVKGYDGITVVHPVGRFIGIVEHYLESKGAENDFYNFRNVMRKEELDRDEQILELRADGTSREEAEAITDGAIEQRRYDRGNMLAYVASEFLSVKPEDLQNLDDAELIRNYDKYTQMHYLAADMANVFVSKDFKFTPEDRKICDHMLDLYPELIRIEARIQSISNPYYKLLDTDRLSVDMKTDENLMGWAASQTKKSGYFMEISTTALTRAMSPASREKKSSELQEQLRTELDSYLKGQLGIKLEDVTKASVIDQNQAEKKLDLKKGSDIAALDSGKELKLVCKDSCYVVKKDENTHAISHALAPETASLRVDSTLKEQGFDPKKVNFTDLDGNALVPAEMDWKEYVSKNPVIAVQDDKEMKLSVGEDYSTTYKYTPETMVRQLDTIADGLGFYPTLVSYNDKDGNPLDFSTDEARSYIAGGNPVTVSDGDLKAEVTLDDTLSAKVNVNSAVEKRMLADKLDDLNLSSENTVFTKDNGEELNLDAEEDMKYINDGGAVIAVDGSKEVKLSLTKGGMLSHEYTEYHKDNVKLGEKRKEVQKAASDQSTAVAGVRAGMNHDTIKTLADGIKSADVVRLRMVSSRQFRRMREEFDRYALMSRNYSENDLKDPQKRKELEKNTARLLKSAKEYIKYKNHHNSGKSIERIRMSCAGAIIKYAKSQLEKIDNYTALGKKIAGLNNEITSLETKIKNETPAVEKAKQQEKQRKASVEAGQRVAFDRMEAAGLGDILKQYQEAQNQKQQEKAPEQKKEPAEDKSKESEYKAKERKEFNTQGKSRFTSMSYWLDRSNANLDRMNKWTEEQFNSNNKDCMYDKLNLSKAGEQLDKEGQAVFGKYLVNFTICKMVSTEQKLAFRKNEDEKKGPFEKMTENKKSLAELERRIRDTDAYKKVMKGISTGTVRNLVKSSALDGEMSNLYNDIYSQMKAKLKSDIDRRNKVRNGLQKKNLLGKVQAKVGKS